MVMSPSINSGEPPVALKKAVCAGRITLAQAQQAIAQIWTIALRRLGATSRARTIERPGRQRLIDLLADSFLAACARATRLAPTACRRPEHHLYLLQQDRCLTVGPSPKFHDDRRILRQIQAKRAVRLNPGQSASDLAW